MALIKCIECGKEISDKAVACPHCGCPVFNQNENQASGNEIANEPISVDRKGVSSDYGAIPDQNTAGEVECINSVKPLQPNVKKKKLKGWHKVLISIASVVCVVIFLFVIFVLIPAIKTVNSYNEISPYLDYVGDSHPNVNDPITLTEEEYNNIDKVELLGMAGEVSFQLRDGYISSCTWTSNDFCSEEKYRAFADDLYVLFDSEPEVEDYSYGNGNTYRYYWTDSYYDLDVTMAHGFFAYDPDGKIEIKWEVPEGTIEESEGIAEKDIKMVENIFSLSHQEIILEHSDVYGDSKNLYMEGEFAGVSGTYSICLDDGQVWRVVFKPDERGENQDKIIDTIIDFLGEYKEYDSKWNSYTWETNTLEIEFYAEENIYFDWIGEDLEVNNEDNTEEDADLEIGVVENVHTAADIPDALMNDEFKSIVDLFSKGYSDSGLDVSDAETYDDGETNIFYLEGIEFLGEEPEDGYFSPRIIYSKDAINNNGTPEMIYLAFSYPRKSNGYEETVEKVEDIAKALGISDDGLIDNDYSSSSKWATGEYATFTFSNLNLKLTVSNMQSSVEIEIVPID